MFRKGRKNSNMMSFPLPKFVSFRQKMSGLKDVHKTA
jgi:hypothetical protein